MIGDFFEMWLLVGFACSPILICGVISSVIEFFIEKREKKKKYGRN